MTQPKLAPNSPAQRIAALKREHHQASQASGSMFGNTCATHLFTVNHISYQHFRETARQEPGARSQFDRNRVIGFPVFDCCLASHWPEGVIESAFEAKFESKTRLSSDHHYESIGRLRN